MNHWIRRENHFVFAEGDVRVELFNGCDDIFSEVDLVQADVWSSRVWWWVAVPCDPNAKEVVGVAGFGHFKVLWDRVFEVVGELFVAEGEQVVHIDGDDDFQDFLVDYLGARESVRIGLNMFHTAFVHHLLELVVPLSSGLLKPIECLYK